MNYNDDLLNFIPRPDELPDPNPPEEDINEWLGRILPPLGELMKRNVRTLHAGKSLRLKLHGSTGRAMWEAHSDKVVAIFNCQGYEATPITESGLKLFLEVRLKK